jgi:nickel/cobalt transporter (NicO) family protein
MSHSRWRPIARHGARTAARAVPAACVIAMIACAGLIEAAAADHPFGIASAPAPGGIAGWIMTKQAAYYREFTGLIRAATADGSAIFTLVGVSFAYGAFHAAGPGHGKAVISSYLIANGETWRRGVALSFASALFQALSAIAVVGIAGAILGGTAKMMGTGLHVIEIASYLLIIGVGLRILAGKAHGLLPVLRAGKVQVADATFARPASPQEHSHHIDRDDAHHHASADDHHHCADHDHPHHDGNAACGTCGHAHGPEPAQLAGRGGWRRGLAAIFAVGLRPCSGAILVLVFALAQGLFWVGAVSAIVMGLGTALTVAGIATLAVGARSMAARLVGDQSGAGGLFVRGLELTAAVVVIAFGSLLLMGYMANEQLFVF